MRSIFVKELNSFFSSIIGYVAILFFLAVCGLFIWILPNYTVLRSDGYATLDSFFELAPWFLMLLIPAITMRSFADEFRAGTIEWLMTKPVRDIDIILGKYLASLVLVVFALVPTFIYVYTINNLTLADFSIDYGGIMGSYCGLFFLAAGFTAIGVFCSSLANNQIVGFLIALFACYLLYSGFEALSTIPAFADGIDYYLSMVGMAFHYESISRGFIDTRDVIYFLSVIVLFISLTRLSLNSRTWDKAAQS
jgi:ABC-2 type transport system permease protein